MGHHGCSEFHVIRFVGFMLVSLGVIFVIVAVTPQTWPPPPLFGVCVRGPAEDVLYSGLAAAYGLTGVLFFRPSRRGWWATVVLLSVLLANAVAALCAAGLINPVWQASWQEHNPGMGELPAGRTAQAVAVQAILVTTAPLVLALVCRDYWGIPSDDTETGA